MVNYLKQSKGKQSLLLLLLVMLLGAFLRFYDLGAESIWYDEASAINLSLQNLSAVIRDCAVLQERTRSIGIDSCRIVAGTGIVVVNDQTVIEPGTGTIEHVHAATFSSVVPAYLTGSQSHT